MFVPLIAFVGVFCTATAARGQKDPNKLKFYVYDFPGESLGWMGDQKWLKTSVYYGGYGEAEHVLFLSASDVRSAA